MWVMVFWKDWKMYLLKMLLLLLRKEEEERYNGLSSNEIRTHLLKNTTKF